MTAEQVPVRELRDHPWRGPSTRVRTQWQGWQQSWAFPMRLPLVLWWAVLLGVVAFGSFLNVYMSARISDARIQLARIDQDLTLQEAINSELLFRIGQEVDLNRIAIWAQNQGLKYHTELLWLDLAAEPAPAELGPVRGPRDAEDALATPARRFQGALDALRDLAGQWRAHAARLRRQMSGFTPLPPETPQSTPRGETAATSFLGELWQSVLEAVNAADP